MHQPKDQWMRSNTFPGQVFLLDGLTGSGKTMIMKLIATTQNVVPPQFNYQLEHLCIAISEKKMDRFAGIEILQLLLDQLMYDSRISRHINFRPRDLSSVLSSPRRLEFLKRLFLSDGESAVDRLLNTPESLFLVVHQLLHTSQILDELPNKKVHRIVCARHPYYLMHHWVSYIEMFGSSPRDFTVTTFDTSEVPWFIQKYATNFSSLHSYDKSALAISVLSGNLINFVEDSPKTLVIDFENFVLNPNHYLTQLSERFGLKLSMAMTRELRRQNLPRHHINDSIKNRAYLRYSSDLLTTADDHKNHYTKLRHDLKKLTSAKYFKLLELAATEYEEKFGIWF